MKTKIKLLLISICLHLGIIAGAGSAWALIPANARIVNNATLTYNDGSGTKTSTVAVTVIVSLVPAAPVVTPGPDQSTSYNGSGTKLTNSFIVTAVANGPDTYGIVTGITGSTNTSGASATSSVTSVFLGATVSLNGSTALAIIVPSDGVSDGKINGIQANSTVVINGETRTVQSFIDNATGTSSIILAVALNKGAPGVGVLVAEQKTVAVDVTAGTIAATGSDVTVSKNITVTSTTDSGKTATSGSVKDTYTSGVASLSKFVRNVTTASGTGNPYSYSSTNYFPTGVAAKPGDILEYILVATNSGSGQVTAAVITDDLPLDFVSLKANTYVAGKEVTYVSDTNVVTTCSAASDGDNATYNAATGRLTIYVGTGATNAAGGSIPGGKSVLMLYQVTVNP